MRLLGPDRLMFVKNEDFDSRPQEARAGGGPPFPRAFPRFVHTLSSLSAHPPPP